MAHAPPLTPMSLDRLLGRIAHEWETRRRIFDLPTARFYDVSSGPDLEVSFLGRPAATPLGPAAGPHSQLAENIVLAWLGGSRVIELKTVQILDELVINRPCIDMETIGYNIEWSQELKIAQSLEEYVKAWMIVEILSGWDELTPLMGADPGPLVFDISVGYDLAGISTPEVGSYIDEIMDATRFIDELRPQIPEPFTKWRHHEFDPRISGTATLSTFHGCPPNEIEDITKHLMTRHGLDVIVKLNPTLLGYDQVGEIVNTALGYDDVRLRKSDFDADLQFDRAIELIGELRRFAAANERRFGIKLTKHARGREPQAVPARRDDVPLGTAAPRCHLRAARQAARRIAGRASRRGQRGADPGELVGGDHQGQLRGRSRPRPGADHSVLRPSQARWLRPAQADAQVAGRGHGRRGRGRSHLMGGPRSG